MLQTSHMSSELAAALVNALSVGVVVLCNMTSVVAHAA